nr:hypothetical protein [Tanacetum cinerariifolium]
MQIAQSGMNMGQDRQMKMIGGNGGNQFRQYAGQNAGNLNGYNAIQNVENQVAQNPRVQNDGIKNQIGNGNLVAVRAKGNATGHNGNQIRYDELTKKELKQIEADDQAIQTILHRLPEDIYAAVDSCETAQEIWLRVQQIMKGSDIGIQEKKAKLFNEWERFTSNDEDSIESYYHRFLKLMNDLKRNKHFPEKIAMLHQDQPSFNQNYMQQPIPNPKDITDPTTAMNMALALMAKAFKLNYSTPTNNNQSISSNPRNRQITQLGMNLGQDRQMHMVGVQNPRIQNVRNKNGLIGVPGNANQNPNENGNLVAARVEGNATGQNGNQIRCYNCRGMSHFARNCTVRPRRRDAAYLQTQLLIAQKEEAGIQLQAEEFDLMAATIDLDEIKKVNVNCILMANL